LSELLGLLAANSKDISRLLREKPSKTHRIQRIRDVNAERLGDFLVTIHTNVLVNGLGLLGTKYYSGWFRTADKRFPRDMTLRNIAIDGRRARGASSAIEKRVRLTGSEPMAAGCRGDHIPTSKTLFLAAALAPFLAAISKWVQSQPIKS
jgi:hypothetical protein